MPGDIPQYPLLSESERPAATTDFIDGCLSDRHHALIARIRAGNPQTYPHPLAVICRSIDRLAEIEKCGVH